MKPPPLKTDLLIDQILSYLHEDCSIKTTASTRVRFCTEKQGLPCSHASDLWNCLQVSRQWFRIAARHLWGRYASFQDLISLVSSSPSSDEQDLRMMNSTQIARWKFYSRFITELELQYFRTTTTNIIPIFELAMHLKDSALLPCLTTLKVGERWTKVLGAQLVMFHLITSTTTKLELAFSPPISYQLLYNYFVALSRRHISLKCLGIRYNWLVTDPRLPNERVAPPAIDSFYPILGELMSLEHLILEPELVTKELLDVVGSLPKLKSLCLGESVYTRGNVGDVMSLDWASHKSRDKAVFTEIASLTVKADISKVETLLKSFFTASPVAFLRIITQTQTNGDEDLSFLKLLPSRMLTSLIIDFIRPGTQQLSLNSLRQAKNLTKLSFIRIMRRDHFIITDYAELGELLISWTHLRHLDLQLLFPDRPSLFSGGLTPDRFARRAQQGIDLSCTSFFAEHLPNLRELVLTIFACNTSSLIPTASTSTFKRLETFKLMHSLLNWRLPDFNQHEAARYLSAVVPSSTRLDIQTIKLHDASPAWRVYEEEYNTFIGSFLEQVKNYTQIRECEATRVKASLETKAS